MMTSIYAVFEVVVAVVEAGEALSACGDKVVAAVILEIVAVGDGEVNRNPDTCLMRQTITRAQSCNRANGMSNLCLYGCGCECQEWRDFQGTKTGKVESPV